ncbi:unnamed protein product, partial [Prorocentrum cordatum]
VRGQSGRRLPAAAARVRGGRYQLRAVLVPHRLPQDRGRQAQRRGAADAGGRPGGERRAAAFAPADGLHGHGLLPQGGPLSATAPAARVPLHLRPGNGRQWKALRGRGGRLGLPGGSAAARHGPHAEPVRGGAPDRDQDIRLGLRREGVRHAPRARAAHRGDYHAGHPRRDRG